MSILYMKGRKIMNKINGIAASTGIAIAKAYQLTSPDLSFEKIQIDNPDSEIERLNQAIEISKEELDKIRIHTEKEIDAEHAEIFSAHILILDDPELFNPIKDKIASDKINAEAALEETADMFITMFENMDNDFMRVRSADIKDVNAIVMANLLCVSYTDTLLISV